MKAGKNWFQSTHSLRSATYALAAIAENAIVSIHALLAECDKVGNREYEITEVSIHALLAECDSLSKRIA